MDSCRGHMHTLKHTHHVDRKTIGTAGERIWKMPKIIDIYFAMSELFSGFSSGTLSLEHKELFLSLCRCLLPSATDGKLHTVRVDF